MQRRGVRSGGELFTKNPVGEHLRQLGEQLQMVLVGGFRHQQHKYQADRLAVGCVKLHRRLEANERADRSLEALDASMGNRDALAEAGGAEFFACEQGVVDRAASDALMIFEQNARLLEYALLAAGVE